MSILNVNKINPVGGGSTITIAGIASVTNNISVGNSVTAGSFVGPIEGNVTGNVTGDATGLSGNPSINTTGIVTATSFVPTTGQLSHRNLVINGDFRIAQRATSSASNGYTSVDRWKMETSNITHNSTKSHQSLTSSDTPYTLGFRKFARIALAQAGVVASNSAAEIQQRIEAQDIATSGWNHTSASSNITLQFWFRCSTNQTFYGYFYSFDGTAQVYTFSFTASGNNTWTKITKTIPGNSNLTIDNDNGPGLQLKLIAFYGTDYTNNKTLDQWAAYDGANQMPDMASTWLTAGASTFDITGVQLEVGPVATPFEHRSYGDELARCQRYFFNITGDNGSRSGIPGYANATNELRCMVQFPVPMRVLPTVSGSSTAMVFDSQDDSASFNCSSLVAGGAPTTSNPTQMCIEVSTSGMTNGQGGQLEFRAANGFINFSAEL